MSEEKNAIIKGVSISNADHGTLSVWVNLDYGGTGQGFGGYSLYSPKFDADYTGIFIWRVMEISGVSDWSKVVGKTVRVRANNGRVEAIGHILKDDWFDPSREMK